MSWFSDLIHNQLLITAISSWIVAQVIKFIVYSILNKEFNLYRLFGDGGMPSGHSATVTSLAVVSALQYGMGSFQFAITAILAVIVCHDAMGVRLETGKQAVLLNEIVKAFNVLSTKELPEVKLKEFVGHTPVQVMAGIAVGFANALVMYYFIF